MALLLNAMPLERANFEQAPAAAIVLPVHPTTTLTGTPQPSQLSPAATAGDSDG
jgi:hypothetical protein